jgi:hypothetical protein
VPARPPRRCCRRSCECAPSTHRELLILNELKPLAGVGEKGRAFVAAQPNRLPVRPHELPPRVRFPVRTAIGSTSAVTSTADQSAR